MKLFKKYADENLKNQINTLNQSNNDKDKEINKLHNELKLLNEILNNSDYAPKTKYSWYDKEQIVSRFVKTIFNMQKNIKDEEIEE